MRVLIIGGTGIISTGITRLLVERGDEVVLYNRGRRKSLVAGGYEVITGDRRDFAAFEKQMASAGHFDGVIDMFCFNPAELESAIRAFKGRTDHYVFCSTVDVYTGLLRHHPLGRGRAADDQLAGGQRAVGGVRGPSILRPDHCRLAGSRRPARGGVQRMSVERWGVFEVELQGPAEGNPFVEVALGAEFRQGDAVFKVPGFYDGDGIYKVRFMPAQEGEWTYRTHSNAAALNGQSGSFCCTASAPNNHGPVRVRHQYHFGYEDGTPYFPFGTTCYAWIHQGHALEQQTLKTLETAGFNKLRMCVFPKDYIFNKNEPVHYPFAKKADGSWDFTRYDVAFFRHLEQRVAQLGALGIEADIILFHPYDRWGYAKMAHEQDYAYLRYVVARLAALRNVWWSMANEYDFMLRDKPMEVWDRFFEIVQENDPYGHLRSIHNGRVDKNYDHTKPGVTHVCVQNWDVKKMRQWRAAYGKPVIDDECEYEGNILRNWGNITARELVHRYWICIAYGGYAGHGETYEHPEDILWWSKGGVLHGESWPRLKFLRQIVEQGPAEGIEPFAGGFPWDRTAAGQRGNYRLIYFGEHQPRHFGDGLPQEGRYEADVIDTWEMTVETLGTFEGRASIELPGRPGLALRVRPVE